MADPAEEKPEASQDMGGLIMFIPDISLEWELGFEIDIVFEGEEL